MSSKLKLELRQPGSRGYTQTHATEYLPYSLRRKRGSACMLLERGSGGRGVRETADVLGSLVFQDAEVSSVCAGQTGSSWKARLEQVESLCQGPSTSDLCVMLLVKMGQVVKCSCYCPAQH